jgi:cysteinyl-tRNA synthetase
MNFTDVDDKIIIKAREQGVDPFELGERYIREFEQHLKDLNILPATINPRATREMDQIIEMIKGLVKIDYAYAVDGDVYFRVQKDPAYGKLSGRRVEEMQAGARIEVDERKQHPMDFALWKSAKPGEPSWDSPWGKGRPGWHIECSAMNLNHLGDQIDIHGGGNDLIFPHHENEIAQSEAATGHPFARYWMHNGYINVDNQKMSKSLNNFFTVRDIAKEFDLEAVRMFMLSVQYRNPVNFSRDMILQAQSALERLRTAKERLAEAQSAAGETDQDAAFLAQLDEFKARFCEAMDDDLNTADAIGVLFDFARAANTFVTEPRGRAAIEAGYTLFSELTGVLGLLIREKTDAFPAEATELLNERQAARKAKNFARADEIRDALKDMGFTVEDTANGPKLKKI